MENFTQIEKKQIINNVNKTLEYIATKIQPHLHKMCTIKFYDDPMYKPIMFICYAGKNKAIEFTRGFNSTKYYLGKYDSQSVIKERESRKNFFESYSEMFAFLKNWNLIKQELLHQIESERKIINEFQI